MQFDSSDVTGVIEDLDLLLKDFLAKIEKARTNYLMQQADMSADEQLESVVYGRFLEPEQRRAFFEDYTEIEALWEILSPSPELRDHMATYKRLTNLYSAVRNAYAKRSGILVDLANKTRLMVQDSATQEGPRTGSEDDYLRCRHARSATTRVRLGGRQSVQPSPRPPPGNRG